MSHQDLIRIMSYNVRCSRPVDGDNTWPQRRKAVAGLIRSQAPHLIGFQEPFIEQVEDLAARLADYAWIGVGRDNGERAGEFNPIFYRQDRFKLLDWQTQWLSDQPDTPGSLGWDARWPRIVTWARFRNRRSGRELFHFNTHLDHEGEQARMRGAALVSARIDALANNTPVVLTGDFNCTSDEAPYQQFVAPSRGLADSMATAEKGHQGPKGSYPALDPTDPPRRRIDFILTRYLRVLRHTLVSDSKDGRYPSDHLPVVVDVVTP